MIINLVHNVARVIDNTTNSTTSSTHNHTGEHPPISLDELDSRATGGYTNETTPVKLPAFSSEDQSQTVSGNSTNRTRAEILKSLNVTAANAINSNISSWSAYYLRLSLLKQDLIGAQFLSEMGGMALFHALFNSTNMNKSHNETSLPSTPPDRRRGANIMARIWQGLITFLTGRRPQNRLPENTNKDNPPENPEEAPKSKEESRLEEQSDQEHEQREDYPGTNSPHYGSFNIPDDDSSDGEMQHEFDLMEAEFGATLKREAEMKETKQYVINLIEQQAGDASMAQMTSETEQKLLSLMRQIHFEEGPGMSSSVDTLKKQRLLELRAELLNDKIDAPILNALGKALKNPQETVQAMVQNLQQQPLESGEDGREPIPSVQSVLRTLPKEAERIVQLTKSLYEFPPTHRFEEAKENLPEEMLTSKNPLPSMDKIPSLVTQVGILSTLDDPSDLVQKQLVQVDATLKDFTSAAKKSNLAGSMEMYLHTPLQLADGAKGRAFFDKITQNLNANREQYYDEPLPDEATSLVQYLISNGIKSPPGYRFDIAIQRLFKANLKEIMADFYSQATGDSSLLSPAKQEIASYFKEATLKEYVQGFSFEKETITAIWNSVLAEKDSDHENKEVRSAFTEMQKDDPDGAAKYLVTKLSTKTKQEFLEQIFTTLSDDPPDEADEADGEASAESDEKLILKRDDGEQQPFELYLENFVFSGCDYASQAMGQVFFAYDLLDDQRLGALVDVDTTSYEQYCNDIKKTVLEAVKVDFNDQRSFKDVANGASDDESEAEDHISKDDIATVLENALEKIRVAVERKPNSQMRKDSSSDLQEEEQPQSQEKLFQDLLLLKVNALSSTDTDEGALTEGILHLTQPRMNAVAKSALEQVAELSSHPEDTYPEDEQAVKVTERDAVAFLSLGSTISQSTRVEDVWHNAVNELLVEADVHAALIGIKYYNSEKYDEISRSLKTHTDKVTSDMRSSLREYTRELIKDSFQESKANRFFEQTDIDGISTFVSILQPDPINAMKMIAAIYPGLIHFDYNEVEAARDNIIATGTSGFAEIVKQEFWKNAVLEASDPAVQTAAEHFKQTCELIQSHALERINELMRSPEFVQQNWDVGSLDDMKRFLSQSDSPSLENFLEGAARLLQHTFGNQYAAKVQEENNEIDESEISFSKMTPGMTITENNPPRFSVGSNLLPEGYEPGDEPERGDDGDDDSWKDKTPPVGGEQSQGGAEPSFEME
eukprot:Nk52_evm11s251 gene=Nk52_evmTU11s251